MSNVRLLHRQAAKKRKDRQDGKPLELISNSTYSLRISAILADLCGLA